MLVKTQEQYKRLKFPELPDFSELPNFSMSGNTSKTPVGEKKKTIRKKQNTSGDNKKSRTKLKKEDKLDYDPIIMNQEWFDGPDNTGDEERAVMKLLKEQDEELESLLLPAAATTTPAPVPPPAPLEQDLFGSLVKECLAIVCIGKDALPSGTDFVSSKEKEDPETYQDKLFYFTAKEESLEFRTDHWVPLKDKLFLKIQLMVLKISELKQFHDELIKTNELHVVDTTDGKHKNMLLVRSATKNDSTNLLTNEKDLNRWKCIHNFYHLVDYICACVLSRVQQEKPENLLGKSLIQLWKIFSTEKYFDKPISKWDDLSGYEFVDNIKELYNTFENIKQILLK